MRDKLVDGAYAAGWATVKLLPEPVARALGNTLADFTWRRQGKGVRQLEANLRRVRPGASPAELRELSRAGMRSYLRYWMESFRLPVWNDRKIADSMRVDGIEHLVAAMESNRGAVLALPHMGNWDLAGAWVVRHLGFPFTTVAERLKPESLFDRFVAYRQGLGMEVLALTGSDISVIGTLARRLRAGKLVCLVGDRDLSESGTPVEFFGEAARMPAGPAALAQQTGAALLPASLWYEGAVQRARIHPPIEVPPEVDRRTAKALMTQQLADVWAAEIAEHPQDWHMLQKFWPADLPGRPRPAVPPTEEIAS
ncbi:phosphatidylinositol mannoside acyltransferase [Streptomyces tateyamensis]|uniref:Phosphatidylinositol mannoside acyltransferase n=1 Tax=Streptomyces tateyamensis TaxID=565073 RepID=A0A2V4MXY8_9ACTN|nr:phosphatidylinositol mannoside acyltransferase [Streptomyces tateyamensis]PYC76335.1 phosphatidylinositol mannoside acyltransferase [Streptomyces tateyamensis]